MSEAVLLAEDGFLAHTGLYVLVHLRPDEAQHQAVGPGLVHEARLGNDGLVVIRIVEAADAHQLFVAEAARFEVQYGGIDTIVVVRIVLESVQLVGEAVAESLPEADVGLVRIERAVRVGCVEKPAAALFARHDVDDSADGVRAEAYGHHTFIYLDALGKADGDVVQAERAACALLRDAVDEHLDVLAAEAIHHHLHVRTHAARLAQLHARCLGQRFAQVLGGVLQFFGVYRYGVESRTLDAAHTGRNDGHFVQLLYVGGDGDVHLAFLASPQVQWLLHCLVAYGRDDQCIFPLKSLDAETPFTVGCAAEGSSFQVNGGEIDCFFLGRSDFARYQASVTFAVEVLCAEHPCY